MSEQEIDAELCRYEPLRTYRQTYVWSIQLHSAFQAVFVPHRVPVGFFALLHNAGFISKRYRSREAAFADLRQAIAARALRTGA